MTDPLQINVSLANVETSFPLLPEGDVTFQIAESVAEPNKDKNGLNWRLKLVTVSPLTAVDGRTVNVNTPVSHYVALQPKAESTDPEAYKRSICDTVDAIFGTDKTTRPDLTRALIDSATGKTVIGHVVIDEYQGNKNNKIKRLKKVAA